MSEVEKKTAPQSGVSAGAQREHVAQQLADVQARLEKKGVGAAFYRAAKRDPIGDMGFMGSLFLHAILGGPLEGLLGDHLDLGHHGEFDSTLTLGAMEGVSALSEMHDRQPRRIKSAFYPLGRNKSTVKAGKKAGKAAAGSNSRFCPEVHHELAFMFDLMDKLNDLEVQEAIEEGNKRVHLVTKKPSSTVYQGVERRRRPRPEGMFNA